MRGCIFADCWFQRGVGRPQQPSRTGSAARAADSAGSAPTPKCTLFSLSRWQSLRVPRCTYSSGSLISCKRQATDARSKAIRSFCSCGASLRRIERARLSGATMSKCHKQSASCVYCGSTTKLTVDHVVPISRWREFGIRRRVLDNKSNRVLACLRGNAEKGNLSPREWFALHPEYRERFRGQAKYLSDTIKGIAGIGRSGTTQWARSRPGNAQRR